MHIAYVDDTKQRGQRASMGDLVALGAVIFAEEQLKPFSDAFYAAYDTYDVPRDVELKWAYSQKKNWFRATRNTSKQTPLRKAVLDAAHAHGARVIVVIWDLGGGVSSAGGQGPEDAVITFMFERISMQLSNLEHRGLIVFDKPGGDHRDEDAWLTGTRSLTELGTDYVKPDAIVTPVLTAPSHHHPHLQLADLIAGSVTNAVAGGKHGMALVPHIRPMFCTNWLGYVGSTGLKLYPDKLNNLHHWVNGEDTYTRGRNGVGLPWGDGGWRYATDDGIAAA